MKSSWQKPVSKIGQLRRDQAWAKTVALLAAVLEHGRVVVINRAHAGGAVRILPWNGDFHDPPREVAMSPGDFRRLEDAGAFVHIGRSERTTDVTWDEFVLSVRWREILEIEASRARSAASG